MGHVELAKKMRKRDPATAPTIGDRVAYVHLKVSSTPSVWDTDSAFCLPGMSSWGNGSLEVLHPAALLAQRLPRAASVGGQ